MDNKKLKISIIITNYNYGKYIAEAIESALNQDYKNKEIIVVDDGSTDNSRDIIERYRKKIKIIYQKNQGHISATNVGFENSKGDIVTFLDADDYLFENMCSEVIKLFSDTVAKVHYKLMEIDAQGKKVGPVPSDKFLLSEGPAVYKDILEGTYITALGNAYNRKLVEELFPLPKVEVIKSSDYLSTIPPDAYLNPRVPFYGSVNAINKTLAAYRKHGENYGAIINPYRSFLKRRRYLVKAKYDTDFIMEKASELGLHCDKEIRFRRYELLRLRLISLRIDQDHPWPNDNCIYLIYLAIKNLRYPPKTSYFHNMFYILWMFAVLITPKRILKKKYQEND